MERTAKFYFKLFYTALYISAFTFGGGYVIISLMKKKFSDELGWIDEDEMMNMTAIAQSTPGAVAVNAAMVVGFKVGGLLGAVLALIATILPPLIIITSISFCYEAFQTNAIVAAALGGMQAGVAAVIADVVISMGGKITAKREWHSIAVMTLSFCAVYFWSVNVLYIFLCCAVYGILNTLLHDRRTRLTQGEPHPIQLAADQLEQAVEELFEEVDC